jgi:hypothetical protein
MRRALLFILFVAGATLLLSCSGKKSGRFQPAERRVEYDVSFAVAPFENPSFVKELLAGYIPEDAERPQEKTLRKLDEVLAAHLGMPHERGLLMTELTAQCKEVVLAERDKSPMSALTFWVKVGECMQAERLLVPQVVDWKQRIGQEISAERPAGVILDMFIVDVQGKRLAARYHFDETQQDLSQNLFQAGKFFERGVRWISAEELAEEGISKGVKELGL